MKTACHIKYIYIFKIFTNFIWIFMLITTPWYFIFYLYDYIKVYLTRQSVAHSAHCVFPEIYSRPSTAFHTLTHAVKWLSLFLLLTNKEIFIFFFISSPNIIRQLELRLLKIKVLWGGTFWILNKISKSLLIYLLTVKTKTTKQANKKQAGDRMGTQDNYFWPFSA